MKYGKSIMMIASASLMTWGCAPAEDGADANTEAVEATDASADSADGFNQACGADIADVCSEVTPGDGRIQACLYAHQDTITDACFAATEQSGVILERVFDRYNGLYEACGADIQTHCGDVEFGGGNLIMCLNENLAEVSEGCTAELPSIASLSGDGA